MTRPKRHGLVLDLPGAPPVDHTVAPMPYLFNAVRPFEVGDDQPITLQQARRLDKDPYCPLKLVEIPDDKPASRGEKED